MDKFIIRDVHPKVDGEYPFDAKELIASFTQQEWHLIKELAGVRRGEFYEALAANDNDLTVTIAYIVLRRNGIEGRRIIDMLWETTGAQIEYVDIDDKNREGESELPPTEPPTVAA
jgi:hypothetical protein